MNKFDIVQKILSETTFNETLVGKVGKAFAPSNIALIKCWENLILN